MYIPRLNLMADQAEAVAFMQQYSFATVITAADNVPVATHLPVVVAQQNGTILLRSHFAKANEQWMHLQTQQVLVIFTEPHAYISPTHYEKELNVPTWNYIAVHAYGRARLVTEPQAALELLQATIDTYEPAYQQQWNGLPQDFRQKMLNGIVAFEMEVTDLQGKKKLSQNRTGLEKEKIIAALGASSNSAEQAIARYMKG